LTLFHGGADGADALQGNGQQCPSGLGNDDWWKPGGLRSLAAVAGLFPLPKGRLRYAPLKFSRMFADQERHVFGLFMAESTVQFSGQALER
jgi:hypothetical protein